MQEINSQDDPVLGRVSDQMYIRMQDLVQEMITEVAPLMPNFQIVLGLVIEASCGTIQNCYINIAEAYEIEGWDAKSFKKRLADLVSDEMKAMFEKMKRPIDK